MSYSQVADRIWRHAEADLRSARSRLEEIVRYATLAPSGHNTQCWRFRIQDDSITVSPDLTRRTPVVDPDDHHLYVSLGCAIENLVLAAWALGYSSTPVFDASTGATHVTLEPAEQQASPLFDAIPQRQCTRADFDGRPVNDEALELLLAAGTGRGVQVLLITDRERMEQVLDFVVQGNTRQINNPDFVQELEHWIRFSDREAIRHGDGLTSRSTGNPPTPRWLGRTMFRMMLRTKPENAKITRQIRSSAGIAVFASATDDPAHWIEAGRCYQRFALQATALGIRNAFINQPVEESGLRPSFAEALGLGDQRPDLVVRFGYARPMPRSLRRDLTDVIDP